MEVLGETENRYERFPTMRRELTQAGMPEPEEKLLRFCAVPRTRQEIAEFLGIKSVPYAIKTHVMPLVEQGRITLALPEKCSKSPKQRYTTKPQ